MTRFLALFMALSLSACGDDGGAAAGDGGPIDAAAIDAGPQRAVDLIVVVDNSGGQDAERDALETSLEANLIGELDSRGIEYQLVLVTSHGDGAADVCIGALCGAAPTVMAPLYHYSTSVASKDSWCVLLDTAKGTTVDDFGLQVGGWTAWLAADSLKVFIYLGNDGVQCDAFDDQDTEAQGETAAASFDQALLAVDSALFGTAAARNYVWMSVVGMPNGGAADVPTGPLDPISVQTCAGAVAPGTGHQALSVLTAGARFSLCDFAGSGGAVLDQLADEIVDRL